jgi:NADH:ubiquinone oxidoreductase subunit K
MLLIAAFSVIYTAITAGISRLGFVEILTIALGTAAYGFAGAVLLFKKRTYPSVGFAFLGLSAYYIAILFVQFVDNYIILSMTEQLVKLIITVMLALFYLSAGRMFIRAESKSTRMKACVFGFFAVTVAISEIAAKLIFLFGSPAVTRDALMRSSSAFIMPDMLAAAETIALLTLLLTLLRRRPERVKADGK